MSTLHTQDQMLNIYIDWQEIVSMCHYHRNLCNLFCLFYTHQLS